MRHVQPQDSEMQHVQLQQVESSEAAQAAEVLVHPMAPPSVRSHEWDLEMVVGVRYVGFSLRPDVRVE